MASRYFALIPAAGYSSRMGQPKLLMPLDGRPIIAHTIEAWQRSGVDRVVVVVRPGDAALAVAVREAGALKVQGSKFKVGEANAAAAEVVVDVVVPEVAPVDMKESLKAAVEHVERCYEPREEDAFLVAPADMPRLSAAIIDRLIGRHGAGGKKDILAPTIGDQRGHPVLFPWKHAAELFLLGKNEGLNTIVERNSVLLVPCEELISGGENPFADVDTPQEYERLTRDYNF